jgi:hypothetical protein
MIYEVVRTTNLDYYLVAKERYYHGESNLCFVVYLAPKSFNRKYEYQCLYA